MISLNFILDKKSHLELALYSKPAEWHIGIKEISRFGELAFEDVKEELLVLKKNGHKLVLVWDILMTEEVFSRKAGLILNMQTSLFDAIRVQDSGAFQFCLDHLNIPIQLILETGNKNSLAVKTWIGLGGTQLKRIVLSPEIPKAELQEFTNFPEMEFETLVLGRILLFYSPRSLVNPLFDNLKNQAIEVSGNSEESPHSGFPIVENGHGSFMFNPKDLSLLPHLDEISEKRINWGRVDLNVFKKEHLRLMNLENLLNNIVELDQLQRPLIKGFFRINKTDVLFKKLKNQRLQNRDHLYLGEVVEVEKKSHIALLIKNSKRNLKIGDEIELLSPDGKEKRLRIHQIRNIQGELLDYAEFNQVILLNALGGISVKTQVFFKA